jgi:hypothetical protein
MRCRRMRCDMPPLVELGPFAPNFVVVQLSKDERWQGCKNKAERLALKCSIGDGWTEGLERPTAPAFRIAKSVQPSTAVTTRQSGGRMTREALRGPMQRNWTLSPQAMSG